jgi:hypothetical protein
MWRTAWSVAVARAEAGNEGFEIMAVLGVLEPLQPLAHSHPQDQLSQQSRDYLTTAPPGMSSSSRARVNTLSSISSVKPLVLVFCCHNCTFLRRRRQEKRQVRHGPGQVP